MSRTARDITLVGLCWAVSRLMAHVSLEAPSTLAFDEAQYLEESFLLWSGTPAVFYKGPFIYLLGAAGFQFAHGREVALAAGLLMDLALVLGFWWSVRRDDRSAALTGALLLASCPLAAWFSMHLLTDVPLAAFSFLCVHAWCRSDAPRARVEATLWLVMALLVKSTAILLLPILILCALMLRRPARASWLPLAAGVAVYLALPFLWSQTSDATFLEALPWMSLRCGVLFFPLAAFLAAGPVLTIAAAARCISAAGPAATGALGALTVLAGTFTIFGDPQPKYVMTFVPFLALLAGQRLARARPMAIALCVVAGMIWITPVVRLMEEDSGMTAAAQYLDSLPLEAIHTTIPEGVHRHAFSGALRFAGSQDDAPELRALAGPPGAPMAIWTDYSGAPDRLEGELARSGQSWKRLDFYTNRNERPIYLVGMDAPPPAVLRWEPNILFRPFVTALDLPVGAAKRLVKRWYQPSRKL